MSDTAIAIALRNSDAVALIDEADLAVVDGWRWYLNGKGYAWGGKGKRRAFMHRLILNPPPGKIVDHVNHQRLDNRRANLRVATHSQNGGNRQMPARSAAHGYRGVIYHPGHRRWQAYIGVNGKQRHLGYYRTALAAALAYDDAAVEVFGEFATLNQPAGHGNAVGSSRNW